MTEFTFTDRLTWISWRADWRARYAEVSERIRDIKRQMAVLHVDRRAVGLDPALTATEIEAARKRIDYRISSLQEDLPYDRRSAHAMMIERTEATEHKNAQIAERTAGAQDAGGEQLAA